MIKSTETRRRLNKWRASHQKAYSKTLCLQMEMFSSKHFKETLLNGSMIIKRTKDSVKEKLSKTEAWWAWICLTSRKEHYKLPINKMNWTCSTKVFLLDFRMTSLPCWASMIRTSFIKTKGSTDKWFVNRWLRLNRNGYKGDKTSLTKKRLSLVTCFRQQKWLINKI